MKGLFRFGTHFCRHVFVDVSPGHLLPSIEFKPVLLEGVVLGIQEILS
jgi:hypothetical protein